MNHKFSINLSRQPKPRKGVFMEIQKIIYKHLWLIDGHF